MKSRVPVLLIACLAMSVPGIAGILYDDGTVGKAGALFIDAPDNTTFDQWISDQFVATASGIADSFDAGIWVTRYTTPTALSWRLGTSLFSDDLGSGSVSQVSYDYLGNRGPWDETWDIYNVHVSGLSGLIEAGSTYYLTLYGGDDSAGDHMALWDVSGGAALGYHRIWGYDADASPGPGEAFTLFSSDEGVPEPATMSLLLVGVVALSGARRSILRRHLLDVVDHKLSRRGSKVRAPSSPPYLPSSPKPSCQAISSPTNTTPAHGQRAPFRRAASPSGCATRCRAGSAARRGAKQ